MRLQLKVNEQAVDVDIDAGLRLIDVLREVLMLRGTHAGCDTAQCGACTVLVDGKALKSCNVLAVQMAGRSVQTIEGLSPQAGTLNPMQQAFSEHQGLQCGYCTPGFVMRAMAMIHEPVAAEPQAVRHALSGNLCRCTGYDGIVAAVCSGLKEMRGAADKAGSKP